MRDDVHDSCQIAHRVLPLGCYRSRACVACRCRQGIRAGHAGVRHAVGGRERGRHRPGHAADGETQLGVQDVPGGVAGAQAEDYPSRPIRFVLPYPSGFGTALILL